MGDEEKALFCEIIASFFLPPTLEIAEHISSGQYYFFFKNFLLVNYEINRIIIKGFLSAKNPDLIFIELKEEYERLFSENREDRILLVESYYKPWTMDSSCQLPFARKKGFLMGDPAIHLLDIFDYYGLEIDKAFKGMPDHLVVELEFLSYLYKNKDEKAIKIFIKDHLDWISLLKEEVKRCHPHPFYLGSLELLNLFLMLQRKGEVYLNE